MLAGCGAAAKDHRARDSRPHAASEPIGELRISGSRSASPGPTTDRVQLSGIEILNIDRDFAARVRRSDLWEFARRIRAEAERTIGRNPRPTSATVHATCTPDQQRLSLFAVDVREDLTTEFAAALDGLPKLSVARGSVRFKVRLAIQPW